MSSNDSSDEDDKSNGKDPSELNSNSPPEHLPSEIVSYDEEPEHRSTSTASACSNDAARKEASESDHDQTKTISRISNGGLNTASLSASIRDNQVDNRKSYKESRLQPPSLEKQDGGDDDDEDVKPSASDFINSRTERFSRKAQFMDEYSLGNIESDDGDLDRKLPAVNNPTQRKSASKGDMINNIHQRKMGANSEPDVSRPREESTGRRREEKEKEMECNLLPSTRPNTNNQHNTNDMIELTKEEDLGPTLYYPGDSDEEIQANVRRTGGRVGGENNNNQFVTGEARPGAYQASGRAFGQIPQWGRARANPSASVPNNGIGQNCGDGDGNRDNESNLVNAYLVESDANLDEDNSVVAHAELMSFWASHKTLMIVLIVVISVIATTVALSVVFVAVELYDDDGGDGDDDTNSSQVIPNITVNIDMVVVVQLDNSPDEIGWSLNCSNNSKLIDSSPQGAYNKSLLSNRKKYHRLNTNVTLGEDCTFEITDSKGNGIDGGFVELFLGRNMFADKDHPTFERTSWVRAFERSGQILNTTKVDFTIKIPQNHTDRPTLVPTKENQVPLTLVIQLDQFPGEIMWEMVCNMKTIKQVGEGYYAFEENAYVTETLYVENGANCTYTITDDFGDGVLDNNNTDGNNNAVVLYFGNETGDSQTLFVWNSLERFGSRATAFQALGPRNNTSVGRMPVGIECGSINTGLDKITDESIEFKLNCTDDTLVEGSFSSLRKKIFNLFVKTGAVCQFTTGNVTDSSTRVSNLSFFHRVELGDRNAGLDEDALKRGHQVALTVGKGHAESIFLVKEKKREYVTVALQLDRNAEETSWTLSCDGYVIVDVDYGTYESTPLYIYPHVTEIFSVSDESNKSYNNSKCKLTIRDAENNGIGDPTGYYAIYSGKGITGTPIVDITESDNFTNNVTIYFNITSEAK